MVPHMINVLCDLQSVFTQRWAVPTMEHGRKINGVGSNPEEIAAASKVWFHEDRAVQTIKHGRAGTSEVCNSSSTNCGAKPSTP